MGEKSAIEWTDATWNPVTGCSKVSPGCAHCYAETLSLRRGWSTQPWTPEHAIENVVLHPERMMLPLKWRKPRRIFVNSMSDLFHELVPDKFIAAVFGVMLNCPQHTFQVLTKRPERMHAFITGDAFLSRALPPQKNVWLGVSVENQHWADIRVPLLLDTPAAVRFLSCEPLLAPVDLWPFFSVADKDGELSGPRCNKDGSPAIKWVITGGESGTHFRPFNPDWASTIRDQCYEAGVAYLHKQNGGRTPKAGGRLLDGRTWDEYPDILAPLPDGTRNYRRRVSACGVYEEID